MMDWEVRDFVREIAATLCACFPDAKERRRNELFRALAPALIATEPSPFGKMEKAVALMKALESDYVSGAQRGSE